MILPWILIGLIAATTFFLIVAHQRHQLPPSVPPPALPPSAEEQAEKERLIAQQHQREEEAHAQQAAQKRAQAAHQQLQAQQLHALITKIVNNLKFTARLEWLGRVKMGERAIGVETHEVPYVGDTILVRPMRGVEELHLLVDSDRIEEDDDVFFARLASGDSHVVVHTEDQVIREDVYEEQWKEHQRVLYILLDVSPSMFPDPSIVGSFWRPSFWQPLCTALIEHAQTCEATVLLRVFGGKVGTKLRAVSADQFAPLTHFVQNVNMIGSTDIPQALNVAIQDFREESYTTANIVIVTDGENNQPIDVDRLKSQFLEHNITLDAVLLGMENGALRTCANRYQVIDYDRTNGWSMSGPVTNT